MREGEYPGGKESSAEENAKGRQGQPGSRLSKSSWEQGDETETSLWAAAAARGQEKHPGQVRNKLEPSQGEWQLGVNKWTTNSSIVSGINRAAGSGKDGLFLVSLFLCVCELFSFL